MARRSPLRPNPPEPEQPRRRTSDEHLYQRAFAAHDLGFARVNGRLAVENRAVIGWGQGRRMAEITGALAVCQLAKLDRITQHMRASKQRIKQCLGSIGGISLRRIPDDVLDTGPFLITIFRSSGVAHKFAAAICAEGVQGSVWLEDYGMHNYFNMVNLVDHIAVGRSGWPWTDPANLKLVREYSKGTLPRTDDLLARSVLSPVPSTLTESQEEQIAEALRKVAEACC